MSCILRVSGSELNIDQMLRDCLMEAEQVWKKGEPRFTSKADSPLFSTSGANFIASNADFNDFEVQLREASNYLEKYMSSIQNIVNYSGVESTTLDFGVELRDEAVHCDYLSPEFLANASKAGVSVEISHYPCSDRE